MSKSIIPETPTLEELIYAGVKVRLGSDPITRNYDLLERYKAIPNHAMFLYTSEDVVLDRYIREHWAALDGLSGDVCDIHISLIQLVGGADAFSQFDELKTILGLETLNAEELPSLHIWSKETSINFLLSPFKDDSSLRDVFRFIFSELKKENSPLTDLRAKEIKNRISSFYNHTPINGQSIINAKAGRDIIQITHIYSEGKMPMKKPKDTGGKTTQDLESVQISGGIKQASDAKNASQKIKNASASKLEQIIESGEQKLGVGKYQASGKWAVVGLVLVVVILAFFKWFAN